MDLLTKRCKGNEEYSPQDPNTAPAYVGMSNEIGDKLLNTNLNMTDLSDQSETEEVGKNFGNMVDDRSHTEQCW